MASKSDDLLARLQKQSDTMDARYPTVTAFSGHAEPLLLEAKARIEFLTSLLPKAFEAGEERNHSQGCGRHCQVEWDGPAAPDFETWLAANAAMPDPSSPA